MEVSYGNNGLGLTRMLRSESVFSQAWVINLNYGTDRVLAMVTVSGLGNLGFTSSYYHSHLALTVKSSETQESGLGKKGEEVIFLSVKITPLQSPLGFQRGDLVSARGSGRASTRRHSPCQSTYEQSRRFQRATLSIPVTSIIPTPSTVDNRLNNIVRFHYWAIKATEG